MPLQYANIKLELWRISRIVAHQFSASARDSSCQTSLYIEICMRIDALKLYYGVESERVGSLRIFNFHFCQMLAWVFIGMVLTSFIFSRYVCFYQPYSPT